MLQKYRSYCIFLAILPTICWSVKYNITTAHVLCNMTTAIPGLLSLTTPWKCPNTAQINVFDWCTWTGVLCGGTNKIIQFDLNTKSLTGTLPSTMGKLTTLKYLYLQSNHISSTIPATLGNLTLLISLRLDVNSLEGTVPNTLSKLRSLSTLNLNYNYLTGTLPTGFASTTYNDDNAATTSSFNELTYYPSSQPTGQPSRQPTSQPSEYYI